MPNSRPRSREVPRAERDGLVRSAGAVHERHLVGSLPEEDQRVVVGVHPAHPALAQRHRSPARRDEATVDLEQPGVPAAFVPWHGAAAVLAEVAGHADLVAVGEHRDARDGEEQTRRHVDLARVLADQRADPGRVVEPTRVKLCRTVVHGTPAANSRMVSITETPPRRGTISGEPRNFGVAPVPQPGPDRAGEPGVVHHPVPAVALGVAGVVVAVLADEQRVRRGVRHGLAHLPGDRVVALLAPVAAGHVGDVDAPAVQRLSPVIQRLTTPSLASKTRSRSASLS